MNHRAHQPSTAVRCLPGRSCRLRPAGLLLIGALLLALTSAQPARAEWHIAHGPLSTRWTAEVSPTNALPDYPRPQMTRATWMNLNGLWQFAPAAAEDTPPFGKDLDRQILVPYPMESELSGIMEHHDRAWYRRQFEVPASWAGQRVLLHFGAVDWESKVYVNGALQGTHDGGYDGFTYDITDALKSGQPQELVVGVYDPTDAGNQPRGKQVLHPGGIFYTPTTGIWQTVWLEPVPATHIRDLLIAPDVNGSRLRLTVTGDGPQSPGAVVEAVALDGSRQVGRASGAPGAEIDVPIRNPHLWSPSDPHLYNLSVRLVRGGRTLDAVGSYFGMRKIEIKSDGKYPRMMLNGKFVFEVGELDQGFWPDGIYTAPTDAALRFDLEVARGLGFNMLRKHVKVEPDRWYYWADKLGILIWQDMPAGDNKTAESKADFQQELERMVEGRRNHPSIIMWVIFNEGWGEHDVPQLVSMVKQLDPSRLIDDASGWTDMGVGSVRDAHSYPVPNAPAPEADRAAVVGEFGGLGLHVPGHAWSEKFWGYQGVPDRIGLTSRYEQLLAHAWDQVRKGDLNAIVYTQVSDVETESNGLMSYDRAVIKIDPHRALLANTGKYVLRPPTFLAPTSEGQGVTWRYTFDRPPANWNQPGFDDSGWKSGPGGFGTQGTPGAIVRTTWNTSDIWLRRHFTLTSVPTTPLALRLYHDDDIEVYINGVLAFKEPGYITDYEEVPLTPAARAALKPGDNVIAVHNHQNAGGQDVDVGIVKE